MRIALGVLMLMHGFAHLAGFAGAWKLRDEIPTYHGVRRPCKPW